MVHFFEVENNVLISILSEWLHSVTSIFRLDSAACNRKLRRHFMNLLSNPSLRLQEFPMRSHTHFSQYLRALKWKTVHVMKLKIPPNLDGLQSVIDSLGGHCREKLQEINMAKSYVSIEVFHDFLSTFQSIHTLNIGHCQCDEPERIIESITKQCLKLRSITLAGWSNLKDDSFRQLIDRCCDTLSHIDISACSDLTSDTMNAITTALVPKGQLTYLNVSKCVGISYDSLIQFIVAAFGPMNFVNSHSAGSFASPLRTFVSNHFTYTISNSKHSSGDTKSIYSAVDGHKSRPTSELCHHLILHTHKLARFSGGKSDAHTHGVFSDRPSGTPWLLSLDSSNSGNDHLAGRQQPALIQMISDRDNIAYTLQLFPPLATLRIEGLRYKVTPEDKDNERDHTDGGSQHNVVSKVLSVKLAAPHLVSLTICGSNSFNAADLGLLLLHCGLSLETLRLDCCVGVSFDGMFSQILTMTNRPKLSIFTEYLDFNANMLKLAIKCPSARNNSVLTLLEHYHNIKLPDGMDCTIRYLEIFTKCRNLDVSKLLPKIADCDYMRASLLGISTAACTDFSLKELCSLVSRCNQLQLLAIHVNCEVTRETMLKLMKSTAVHGDLSKSELRILHVTGSWRVSKDLAEKIKKVLPNLKYSADITCMYTLSSQYYVQRFLVHTEP